MVLPDGREVSTLLYADTVDKLTPTVASHHDVVVELAPTAGTGGDGLVDPLFGRTPEVKPIESGRLVTEVDAVKDFVALGDRLEDTTDVDWKTPDGVDFRPEKLRVDDTEFVFEYDDDGNVSTRRVDTTRVADDPGSARWDDDTDGQETAASSDSPAGAGDTAVYDSAAQSADDVADTAVYDPASDDASASADVASPDDGRSEESSRPAAPADSAEETRFCPSCGRSVAVDGDVNFCRGCGRDLRE